MKPPGPVLDYVTDAPPRGFELRRDCPAVQLVLPPPAIWRQVVLLTIKLLWLAAASVIPACLAVGGLLSWRIGPALMGGALCALALLIGFPLLGRLVHLAREGRRPALIEVDGEHIRVVCAYSWPDVEQDWALSSVTDVRVDEAGGLRPLVRFLQLLAVLDGGKVAIVRIPVDNLPPLAEVEAALRGAVLAAAPPNRPGH